MLKYDEWKRFVNKIYHNTLHTHTRNTVVFIVNGYKLLHTKQQKRYGGKEYEKPLALSQEINIPVVEICLVIMI
jgi:hypothetical protein